MATSETIQEIESTRESASFGTYCCSIVSQKGFPATIENTTRAAPSISTGNAAGTASAGRARRPRSRTCARASCPPAACFPYVGYAPAVGRIVNRRNAVIGWAMWKIWRNRARRHKERVLGDERAPRRWARRVVGLLAAALAALGVLALWRKLRGGGEEEWVVPEPLDVPSTSAEPSPLTSVERDDDIPPAA
jgi:hypothetical protein